MIDSNTILSQIKQIVLKQEPTAKVILFGSRAKGKSSKQSDWDILILLNRDKITPELEESITYPLFDLEFETGEIISPMVYTISEWYSKYSVTPLYHNIMQEGKRL